MKKPPNRFVVLRGLLCRAWSRDPERYKILNNPKTKRKNEDQNNKRLKWEHQCNLCKKWFPQSQVQIDHIVPKGSLLCEDDLGPFCKMLFFGKLQKLCKPCHQIKTNKERQEKKVER